MFCGALVLVEMAAVFAVASRFRRFFDVSGAGELAAIRKAVPTAATTMGLDNINTSKKR